MVLTVSFVLPGDRALLPPSFHGNNPRTLAPASGRQDHTTSPSTSAPFVNAPPKRPPHPASYVRDDRDTPLLRRRDSAKIATDLGYSESELFFQAGLDDPNQIEFARKIRVYVASDSKPAGPDTRSISGKNDFPDYPSGKSAEPSERDKSHELGGSVCGHKPDVQSIRSSTASAEARRMLADWLCNGAE
jgi:hypothetical protein